MAASPATAPTGTASSPRSAPQGVAIAGRAVCVLGAGGAARSIVEALARNGRRRSSWSIGPPSGRPVAAALAGRIGRVGSLDDVVAADIVVNATSVGMGTRDCPSTAVVLHGDHVVADIVYHPRRTALLDVAESAGATTFDGLGMLVHQAALQQALWTGRTPDVAVMRAAAERELAAREASAR